MCCDGCLAAKGERLARPIAPSPYMGFQAPAVTVRRRIAPPPAAAKLHVTVFDHAAAQPDGPCHGYCALYHDRVGEAVLGL